MPTIQIADKPTVDRIETKVDGIGTKIGASTDSASASSSTMFGLVKSAAANASSAASNASNVASVVGGGFVKSVQRGSVSAQEITAGTITAAAFFITVSSVNMSKSVLTTRWSGYGSYGIGSSGNGVTAMLAGNLINSTTIEVYRLGACGFVGFFYWELVEYN